MSRSLIALLALVMLTGGCDIENSRPVKSNEAITAWAANDYVACRDTTADVMRRNAQALAPDARVQALHAWCLMALGDLEGARRTFVGIESFDPNNFQSLLGRAWLKIQSRQLDEAERLLKRSAHWAGPTDQTLQLSAEGWLAFYRADFDRAEERFRRAETALFPEDMAYFGVDQGVARNWSTQPWVGMGWVEMYRGRPEAARKAFLKGLERDPGCHRCYGGLARLYQGLGMRRQAFNFAAKGLSLVRHDAALLAFVNKILFDEKNPALSVQLYERLVKVSGGDPLYQANLGYARYYNGDLKGAEAAFQAALKRDSGQPLALAGMRFLACIKAGGGYPVCIGR